MIEQEDDNLLSNQEDHSNQNSDANQKSQNNKIQLSRQVGIGILTLPIGKYIDQILLNINIRLYQNLAFSQSGWILGLVVLVIFSYLSYFSMKMYLNSMKNWEKVPKDFLDFVRIAFKYESNGYRKFMKQSTIQSFCYLGFQYGCTTQYLSIFVALIIILPLGIMKKIGYLKDFILIGTYAQILVLIILSFQLGQQILENSKNGEGFAQNLIKTYDIKYLPILIGNVFTTMEGIIVFFDIRFNMQKPEDFNSANWVATNFIIAFYGLIGFLGYAAYGNKSMDIILLNLNEENYLNNIIQDLQIIQNNQNLSQGEQIVEKDSFLNTNISLQSNDFKQDEIIQNEEQKEVEINQSYNNVSIEELDIITQKKVKVWTSATRIFIILGTILAKDILGVTGLTKFD
ncbi:hypothetical protein PPERSA_04123 [Pseudocohnilembus persalinus]|uniref:Amino acid transporter transmembrane domain-containing protein n=1 Tax=Pseudocohnilembus persalinus TaxID=266149 RepID=A0A0V0QML0_PSEPJ|nr:hypothetical protein PPERSA_04123 [Pseudocohnilembus persalinus]|eukprot:KRX03571.1 hypothetical protein PPERSA_04123 [Pseudocohnilembus persalinus]